MIIRNIYNLNYDYIFTSFKEHNIKSCNILSYSNFLFNIIKLK